MKAIIKKIAGEFDFGIMHKYECKTTKQAKSIAEKLTGEKFNSIGWVGRYSIYKSESGLFLNVETR